MKAETKTPSMRIDYVDRLRGLAVFGMFLVHTPAPWMGREYVEGEYGYVISQISGMIAPVFLFLAGVSAAVIAGKALDKGAGAPFRLRIARRGLEVMMVGYGLNFAFFALRGFQGGLPLLLKVDVLQCIGASLAIAALLAAPARRWNWAALVACAVFVFGAQVTWRSSLHQVAPAALSGYFTFIQGAARFPLLPYAGWVALGLFVGERWWRSIREPGAERRFFVGLVIAALVSFAAGFLTKWIYYRYGLNAIGTDGPPPRTTIHHFLFKAGFVFLLFGLARVSSGVLDKIPGSGLVLFGRTSLFSYCIHLIAAYHVVGPFARKSFGPVGHLLGVACLTAAMFGLCLGWNALRAPRARVLRF